jgi:hypothetical protein
MTMRKIGHLSIAALIAAGVMGTAGGALAAGGNPPCGVTASNVVSIGDYNPFSPMPITNVPVNLTLYRKLNGSAKTQTVNFVMTQPPGSPDYQITYQGINVLYTTPVPAGQQPSINAQQPGQIYYNFGGAAQPDTVVLPVIVTIPAGVDLSAGDPIRFDILYVCNGTGQLSDVTVPSVLPNAVTLNLNVLSALQAYYAGPALDFGEIGEVPLNVSGQPASVTTRSGYFGVKSSGPYDVSVTSENGYRMTFPGGNTSNPLQRVDYEMSLLGQTVYPGSPSFTPKRCTRAGVAVGQSLGITTKLREGGTGKMPAPNYRDILSVTFTPLVVPVSGTAPVPCS